MYTAGGFEVLIRSFQLALTVEGLSTSTVSHYVRDARRFTDFLGSRKPRSVKAIDIRDYLAQFQQSHSLKSTREAQLALRRFFAFLRAEGEIRADPTREMKLANPRVNPQPIYSEAEIKRLLMVCDIRTKEGVRNRAMVLTLYDTGVREGELVSMGLPVWDKSSVTVRGKTGVRRVPLGLATLQAIERYVRRWRITEAPLWGGKRGALTGSGVLQIMRRLCREASVPHKGVHAMRRAAAAQMKRLGMNDSDILEILGWKNVTMLRRYTQAVADELAQEAHRRYGPGDALKLR